VANSNISLADESAKMTRKQVAQTQKNAVLWKYNKTYDDPDRKKARKNICLAGWAVEP